MPSRTGLREHQQFIARIAPATHEIRDAPYEVTPTEYAAYMQPVHDVGGQRDLPVHYEEKEEEAWELNTYVTCEVLAWRGVWNAEERRRRGNNDVGLSVYLGVPYYGRWILAAARMLVDKNKISLVELMDKIAEVKARHDSV
jgi:thiocyanate hydrolase subunit beta